MAAYDFKTFEPAWQAYWEEHQTFKAINGDARPPYYVLDMFPYPSGAGLHVGHPLGYIASDIVARFKRHQGYNVLHPMGFDSFGLPAEQYAIETGQHPAKTTATNITRYKEQLKAIGLAYDWSREVQTSDPNYYRWTQWIFLKFFGHYYDLESQKALPIESLVARFEVNGSQGIQAAAKAHASFSVVQWKAFTRKEQADILNHYRLAYEGVAQVNWCADLGTVLSNDEVKDGVSERGGYPVVQIQMRQWFMRITAYGQRLLEGLDALNWSDSMKEAQRNWIGRSEGLTLRFETVDHETVTVFTTRPDTIFGVSFLVVAPEHPLAKKAAESNAEVAEYLEKAGRKTERERQQEIETVSGIDLGIKALHPETEEELPIYAAEYVLMGYGTGAIMAVPGHDSRDHRFAVHFGLPILHVVSGEHDYELEANETYQGVAIESDFLDGLPMTEAKAKAIDYFEASGQGGRTVNYRLRDAIFARQRYWGEPIPIVYDAEGVAKAEENLPLVLPEVASYTPTGQAESPLAGATQWVKTEAGRRETNTMPGWAGSSWYFYRYMDAKNGGEFANREALDYWRQVDLYLGGTEHATGHLLYARFWSHFLHDLDLVPEREPFKRLVNQGMILGQSRFVYRVAGTNRFVSYGLRKAYETTALHVDVSFVNGEVLNIEKFKAWRPEYASAEFELEDGEYRCRMEVEKMSKSKHNVVNPDVVVGQYGADALRLYEMFLGPLEVSKPWDTQGIEGVSRFLGKVWRLFLADETSLWNDTPASEEALKALHKCVAKVSEDIEKLSFNTVVSALMICVNELTRLKCSNKQALEMLLVCLSPLAPHIAEELWKRLGHKGSIAEVPYPIADAAYLKEDEITYPISVNGKVRVHLKISGEASEEEIKQQALTHPIMLELMAGNEPKRVIVVKGRIVNVVL